MDDIKRDRKQDEGANTFAHILDQARDIHIPQLEWIGINHILQHPRLSPPTDQPKASYGTLKLQHAGADSYAGHQEIMGTSPKKPLMQPFVDNMEQVKMALEQGNYRVTVPDAALPYLLVNDVVIVADNI